MLVIRLFVEWMNRLTCLLVLVSRFCFIKDRHQKQLIMTSI